MQHGDNIIDHTVIADELVPRSFLHLGLRPAQPGDDRHIDLILTDLPGEWFKGWSSHNDDTAKQRMSFISRCDAFIVLADASALLAQGGGRTDNETSLLIRRLIEVSQSMKLRPPLALVFSKFDRILHDVEPPPPARRAEPSAWGKLGDRARRTWLALEEARRSGLTVEVFPVSAFPHRLNDGQPVGVMEPFTYVMAHADHREPFHQPEPTVPEGARGFATMRRWRDAP